MHVFSVLGTVCSANAAAFTRSTGEIEMLPVQVIAFIGCGPYTSAG